MISSIGIMHQMYVKEYGMRLATIPSEEKFQEVYKFVKGMDGPVWVGGHKENGTENWKWAGTDISISVNSAFWVPGEPMMDPFSRACIQLWDKRNWKFDDYYCNHDNYYVCETRNKEENWCENLLKWPKRSGTSAFEVGN
uniref:Uncharacterized protein n=1 Tax=Phlebotomus papatasi TaxID=29031 RepID=A0A1B0DBK7_PHLPP